MDVDAERAPLMRAGVIGAGRIARQHLRCLQEMPGVEIAAVADRSRAMAEAAADRFAIKRWYQDHRDLLRESKPDVVHVVTPPDSHYALAKAALEAGSHVIVEKPLTVDADEAAALLDLARSSGLILVEDYNYLFNRQTQRVFDMIDRGAFGSVTHVEIFICLQITAPGSAFVDPNVPNPFVAMEGGAIADFLPHLASLANAFVGPHRSLSSIWKKRGRDHPLPSDEFRALIDAERGTAVLGFSSHTQPDMFSLRVYGTRMRAECNLFETQLTISRLRSGPKPLMPFFNGLDEARRAGGAAFASVWRKLGGGPGAYEGLWELLRQTYAALASQSPPPVTEAQIRAVNQLVRDLKTPGRML